MVLPHPAPTLFNLLREVAACSTYSASGLASSRSCGGHDRRSLSNTAGEMSASSLEQTIGPDGADGADCGPTVLPTSKKRRRTTKRAAQRAQHSTLFHAVAAAASGAWGRLVERTHDMSEAPSLYERRVKLMALVLGPTEHRAMESLEAGPVFCRQNSATILHAPTVFETPRSTSHSHKKVDRNKAPPIEKARPTPQPLEPPP